MPKKSNLGKLILSEIGKILETSDVLNIKWTEIGATLISEGIIRKKLERYVVAPEVFCPNNFLDFEELITNEDLLFDSQTYGIHLWNKMWEWNQLNPVLDAKKKSVIGKAIKSYL